MNKIFLFSLDSGFLKLMNLNNINILNYCNLILYDSLINFNIFNFCFNKIIKILIGKRVNQKSILKKTIYIKMLIYYKKYKILSKIKSGDMNLFSRINNEIIIFKKYNCNYKLFNFNKNLVYNTLKLNVTNILFITYFNNNFNFKIKNIFTNKTAIYYMINNNIFYILNFLISNDISYIILIESFSFIFEKNLIFNLFDLFNIFIDNFISIFFPKILIFNNLFNIKNINNFCLRF